LLFTLLTRLYSLAAKYKLYKKLSKAAASAEVLSKLTKTIDAPSTPPRSLSQYASSPSFLPRKRMVEQALPLASFNPFSPVKDKGKQRLTAHSVIVSEVSSTN